MNGKIFKLKRYKLVNFTVCLMFLPVIVTLMVLSKLGEFFTYCLDSVANVRARIVRFIVKIFNFEEIANKQYKKG